MDTARLKMLLDFLGGDPAKPLVNGDEFCRRYPEYEPVDRPAFRNASHTTREVLAVLVRLAPMLDRLADEYADGLGYATPETTRCLVQAWRGPTP